MIRTIIIALALAALALSGCGEKGAKESPKSEKKAPSPVKAPKVEVPPAPTAEPAENRGVDAPPTVEPEPAENRGVDAPPTAEPEPEIPVAEIPKSDLAAIDLSTIDSTLKLIVMAPGGAAARDDYGAIEIAKEPDFQMEISEEEEVDLLARKKEIEANGVNKLKKYHVDTPDTLLYETEIMGKSEFHFIATVTVGETLLLCEDQKGPVFSQAAVTRMLAACRSAREKGHDLVMPALDGEPGPAMPKIDLD